MELLIRDSNGSLVNISEYLQKIDTKLVEVQSKLIQLEYELKTKSTATSSEAPKSDYEKLKDEIMEEVNLIISDLL